MQIKKHPTPEKTKRENDWRPSSNLNAKLRNPQKTNQNVYEAVGYSHLKDSSLPDFKDKV